MSNSLSRLETGFSAPAVLEYYLMKVKVYFAGSIRGGRTDAELYSRIISFIKKTDIVLTEHIGDKALAVKEKGVGDIDIYRQDTSWLRESDVLIGECTNPSLGVGYELGFAESIGKPCHVFYDRTRTQMSAMITGDSYFNVHPYTSENEIYPVIDKILEEVRIPSDAIESAYCIFHQKQRVYEFSDSKTQKDEIECAVSSYAIGMNRHLYQCLAAGRPDFLMEHSHFAEDLRDAVNALEAMMP